MRFPGPPLSSVSNLFGLLPEIFLDAHRSELVIEQFGQLYVQHQNIDAYTLLLPIFMQQRAKFIEYSGKSQWYYHYLQPVSVSQGSFIGQVLHRVYCVPKDLIRISVDDLALIYCHDNLLADEPHSEGGKVVVLLDPLKLHDLPEFGAAQRIVYLCGCLRKSARVYHPRPSEQQSRIVAILHSPASARTE